MPAVSECVCTPTAEGVAVVVVRSLLDCAAGPAGAVILAEPWGAEVEAGADVLRPCLALSWLTTAALTVTTAAPSVAAAPAQTARRTETDR
jgi:H+/gluconate symporter-like permease